MSHTVIWVAASLLVFFWLLLVLADYGWENRKRRLIDGKVLAATQARPLAFGDYGWYSWTRYLVTIAITYLNAIAVLDSNPQPNDVAPSIRRIIGLLAIVALLSVTLQMLDSYWDRKGHRDFTRTQKVMFWSYFWIRYPLLMIATVEVVRQGFRS